MSIIFWDVTQCGLLVVYKWFGGIYCLHLHGHRASSANKQANKQAASRVFCSLLSFFLLGLHFDAKDGGVHSSVMSKNFCIHGVTSQNTVLFLQVCLDQWFSNFFGSWHTVKHIKFSGALHVQN
jgi:hypothetical protein